jgi:ribosomal protein L12E/L44/L45/RPP1/RPP2
VQLADTQKEMQALKQELQGQLAEIMQLLRSRPGDAAAAAAPAAAAKGGAAADPAKAAAKAPEPEPEEEEAGGFSLFD